MSDHLISFNEAVKAVHAEIKRSASWFIDGDYTVVSGRVIEALVKLLPDQDYTEPRVYKCGARCGAEFIIRFPESVIWDDYEAEALDDAGWVLRGGEYFCPACKEK